MFERMWRDDYNCSVQYIIRKDISLSLLCRLVKLNNNDRRLRSTKP